MSEQKSVFVNGEWYYKQPSAQKRTRPRKSRDRRLLEALVGSEYIFGRISQCVGSDIITSSNYKQLIAIKEAMQRKGGGK